MNPIAELTNADVALLTLLSQYQAADMHFRRHPDAGISKEQRTTAHASVVAMIAAAADAGTERRHPDDHLRAMQGTYHTR